MADDIKKAERFVWREGDVHVTPPPPPPEPAPPMQGEKPKGK